jgi:hypothetical protein
LTHGEEQLNNITDSRRRKELIFNMQRNGDGSVDSSMGLEQYRIINLHIIYASPC